VVQVEREAEEEANLKTEHLQPDCIEPALIENIPSSFHQPMSTFISIRCSVHASFIAPPPWHHLLILCKLDIFSIHATAPSELKCMI
jgi:hypothetical protein